MANDESAWTDETIGLMDAIVGLAETAIMNGTPTASIVGRWRAQGQGHIDRHQPVPAAMLLTLAQRIEAREPARRLLIDPPQGQG